MLQALQTFSQVFVVQLRVKVVRVLLAETLRAEDVKPSALFHQRDGHQVREILLSDVLPHGSRGAPNELEPVAHRLPGLLPEQRDNVTANNEKNVFKKIIR
jgi:hypothetical protein